MNLQGKGARALIASGHKEIKSKSKKYKIFEVSYRPGYLFFLGKKGAIRMGKNVSSSISIGQVK